MVIYPERLGDGGYSLSNLENGSRKHVLAIKSHLYLSIEGAFFYLARFGDEDSL
jgi:hypothetical protein